MLVPLYNSRMHNTRTIWIH